MVLRFLKIAISVIVVFLSLFFVTIITLHMGDEDLTQEAQSFFASSPINIDNNFYITLTGLHAPVEEESLYDFGKKIYRQELSVKDVEILRYNDSVVENDMRHCTHQKQHDVYHPPYKNRPCYTQDDVDKLLNENKKFISRLQDLYEKTPSLHVNLDNHMQIGFSYDQDIIKTQELLCEIWINDARKGQGNKALEAWMTSAKALKHIIQGQLTHLDHMIELIIFKTILNCLPVILESDESLIDQHGEEIIDLLNFDYIKIWNVKDMLQAEGNFLADFDDYNNFLFQSFYQPNKTRNAFYTATRDIIKLSQLSAQNIETATSFLKETYKCKSYIKGYENCLLSSLILNAWFYEFEQYGQMFYRAHEFTAQSRAIALWIRANMENIVLSEMPSFLNDAPLNYHDPINQKPFQWDRDRQSIYHTIIDDNGEYKQKDLIFYNKI